MKVLSFIVRLMLKFDRHVVKRYLNFETPLYKLWWSTHVELTQKKLEGERTKSKVA